MSWTLQTLTRFHKKLHRASGGRIGRTLFGKAPILWLIIPGRVSGITHLTPLLYADDDDGSWIVAGSAGGNSKSPNWALNASAAASKPETECWVERSDERVRIRITEILDDSERASAYKRLVSKWRFFQNYAERASRTIPVFRLIPDEASRRSREASRRSREASRRSREASRRSP